MLDDAALPLSRARQSFISRAARATLALLARHQVTLIGGLWFMAAFATVIYAWGLNSVVFPAQDEAVVRFAAALIRQHGHPFLTLPFADPEDLAHPRSWVSQGATALPIYAPVLLYADAQLLRLGSLGLLVIAGLPAAAVGAFAAGTARLLPVGRRWLALLAPVLGFASFYWLLRPWMNLSSVIAGLCSAFFCWTLWLEDGKARWLAAVTLSVGAAAAVRPDYAGFLMISALLLLLASNPQQWKAILLFSVVSGVCAILPNLILNHATTGHALRAVYQIALDREYGADPANGLDNPHVFSLMPVLKVLFAPMGIPDFTVFTREFRKYFVAMGPAPALLLAQLAIVPILRKKSRVSRILCGAAVLFAVFFVVSRLHGDVFGGPERQGFLHHSVPRYLAPVFLFFALPPLVLLGQCQKRWLFCLGALLASGVAADCSYELYVKQPSSFAFIHHWVRANTALVDAITPEVPKNALVYSAKLDKVLWSRWQVGFFTDDAESSARSMSHGVTAGLPVFVLEPKPNRPFRQLVAALKRKGLALPRVDAKRGLYRLERPAQPAPVP